ncbi:MAG: tRNA (N6-isopentenyl adenosine(37)-C2)-methylthiotransferase MiaB [Candidatus Cloacimonadota bacterium]|nr:tRNA (N6-isopentenyl adenosine(37)-C2)-methylthiotransferase MiaB [Candidatus Cloacimonadota bacterium]
MIHKQNPLKFFIQTYGCQMNVADSEMVSGLLIKSGYELTENIDEADIIIFNSCTVRQHAEDRVIGRITQEGNRKKKKPNLLIGLIGCVAQRCGEELIQKIDCLDFAVGTDQYRLLPKVIENCLKNNCSTSLLQANYKENYSDIPPYRKKGINAFITIMRGCNNFCSYCIVPYVRGRERSRNHLEVLKEIETAGNKGYKDITLLGQNVNSYKNDNIDFPTLLKLASKIDSIKRLRFITSHPKDLSDKLIEVMTNEEKVCEHLHLPLQSGSNTILEKMNRGYSVEQYLSIIKKLKNSIPNIAITTDVMTGFPGETEKDFLDTYNLMKKIRFDYAFTFKYSPRKGTKAADPRVNRGQIDESIRLKRLQKLIALQEKITFEKYKEQTGKVVEVYVEQKSKKNINELSGRTRDNKIAVFPGDKNLIGKFVKVKICDATGWTLRGKQQKI